ncbi:MAG: glycosyltransferase family 2 protein [Pseudomonadota bacterium]
MTKMLAQPGRDAVAVQRPCPDVTAIVPAFNAERFLAACLSGLFSAGFSPDDIIVVDDGSTDATTDIAAQHQVRLIAQSEQIGAAAARNAGARAAATPIILFVDADVVVHRNVKSVISDFFRDHPDHDAVFGVYDDAPAEPGSISRIRNLLHRHVHMQNAGAASTFWSGCGAIRKRAFDDVGGFDPDHRMMEDVALGMSLAGCGKRIRLLPDLQGKHLKAWTLRGMARTDLLDRAIPWARLLKEAAGAGSGPGLNINPTSYASVLLVALSLTGLVTLVLLPWVGLTIIGLSLVLLAIVNAQFLGRLAREGRMSDPLVAIPVLWVHYFCGGLGFAWVRTFG